MKPKNSISFVKHIEEQIKDILEFIKDVSKEDFIRDKKSIKAVVKSIEIIGEASKNISQELKDQYPKIKWRKMARMRDVLTHKYWGIDLNIVWDTVKKVIPELKTQIETVLQKETDPENKKASNSD